MSNLPSHQTSQQSLPNTYVTATAPHGQAARAAMNTTESRFDNTAGGFTYSASAVSEVSSASRSHHGERETATHENTSVSSNRFVDIIPDNVTVNSKIESKDHMWKPAPIMGRDFTAKEAP